MLWIEQNLYHDLDYTLRLIQAYHYMALNERAWLTAHLRLPETVAANAERHDHIRHYMNTLLDSGVREDAEHIGRLMELMLTVDKMTIQAHFGQEFNGPYFSFDSVRADFGLEDYHHDI